MAHAGHDLEEITFRTLLKSSLPVAIFRWRATETWPVEFVSPNVSHVIGYSADDFLSGRVVYSRIIHGDDLARVTDEVAKHSGESVFEHEDYRISDPSGRIRWVRDLTAIVRDEAGKITHFIGYIFESTARHEAQEALVAATQAKTEFFTNVSHEFRTPLTLLLGPLDDLLAGDLAAPQREVLESMQRNALRLKRLVNTLLDFAPIDAGRARASFEPTDLAGFTRDLASFFDSAATAAGLDFVVDCPPLGEPAWIDHEMWEKIVSNLLANALKFTLSGSIRIRLRLDGVIRLDVEDTGSGIPAAERPLLFERFHRVKESRARSSEGTGLGLPLVYELVRLHGGALSVSSTEGVGSTFSVTLPRGHAHLPAGQVSMSETLPPAPGLQGSYALETANSSSISRGAAALVPEPDRTGRPRIVIVDDNADMREYLTRMLGSLYDVECCVDGTAALAAIRQRLPDIVVTDVMMPVMTGFQLLAALRTDEGTRALPIIMLSARAGEEARVEGIEAGADDYLVKPFTARELLARVGTQLALAQMRKQAAHVRRLEAEQAWLGAALDRLPFPLVLAEPESGRATFANRAANALAGGTFPVDVPLIAYPQHYRLTDEHDRELPVDQWPAVRAARGEVVEGAMLVWHTASGRVPLLVSAETLPAMSDHAATVIVAFQNVTELVSAIKARDEFLSIASHELKTPLTSLMMQVQLRQRALTTGDAPAFSPEALARMAASDVRQVDRLTRLVDDILDVSRISSGRLTLELGDLVDLTAAVGDVLERSAPVLAAAGCEVAFDAPPAPIVGRWDRARLEQVVLNLLTNAIKYGRGRPIRCSVAATTQRASFMIHDEGVGIAPLDQERIFQIFERAISANEVSGLGLGLYIARRLVEAHGGSIRVTSRVGEGATFTVELPLESAAAGGQP